MSKILVIDDSEVVLDAVMGALEPLKAVFSTAGSVKDSLLKVSKEVFDLLIIDIGLPDGSGFDLLAKIRSLAEYKHIPVVFLTGKEDVAFKVSAFSLGADGYIVKPFSHLELRARIERELKRHHSRHSDSDQIIAGPFVLEVSSQRLKIKGQKDFIALTSKEFKILLLLTRNADKIFSRQQILDKLDGSDIHVTDLAVDSHIHCLRKKLERYASYIESVTGEGYRFNPGQSPKAVA